MEANQYCDVIMNILIEYYHKLNKKKNPKTIKYNRSAYKTYPIKIDNYIKDNDFINKIDILQSIDNR